GGYPDVATIGELYGIANKVIENLLQPVRISAYRRQTDRDIAKQVQPLAGRQRLGQREHWSERVLQIKRHQVHFQRVILDPGKIENVVNQVGQTAAAVYNHFQVAH